MNLNESISKATFPGIQLCLMATNNEDAHAVLKSTLSRCWFPSVVCHSSKDPGIEGVIWIPTGRLTYPEAMRYQAIQLGTSLIASHEIEHQLCMECDADILNPQQWREHWRGYDYIGAPWPKTIAPSASVRVGNGGLALRSKKHAIACWRAAREYSSYLSPVAGDVFWSLVAMKHGLNVPTVQDAIFFSFEYPVEEFPGWKRELSFGYHRAK